MDLKMEQEVLKYECTTRHIPKHINRNGQYLLEWHLVRLLQYLSSKFLGLYLFAVDPHLKKICEYMIILLVKQ